MDNFLVLLWGGFVSFVSSFWSGLQWPHSFLIVSSALILFFREEIRSVIPRINEFGPGGIKVTEPPAPSQMESIGGPIVDDSGISQEQSRSTESPSAQGIPLPPIVFPAFLEQNKTWIAQEIDGMADQDARSYLFDRLAFFRAFWDFENIYSNIFGGQLRLMQYLNQRVGVGVPMTEIKAFWDTHQLQLKPGLDNWTLDQYLNFLKARGLAEEIDGVVQIQHKGTEFLLWLTQYGRSFERPW